MTFPIPPTGPPHWRVRRNRPERNRAPIPTFILPMPPNRLRHLTLRLMMPFPSLSSPRRRRGSTRHRCHSNSTRLTSRLRRTSRISAVFTVNIELPALRVDNEKIRPVDSIELVSVGGKGVAWDSHGCAVSTGRNVLGELDVGRGPVDEVDKDNAEGGGVGVDTGPGDCGGFALCEGGGVGGGGYKDGVCHERRERQEGGDGELHPGGGSTFGLFGGFGLERWWG